MNKVINSTWLEVDSINSVFLLIGALTVCNVALCLLQDDNCRYNAETSGALDTGYVDITQDSEQDLKAAVGTVGPVSVAIDASHRSFQLYKSGLYVEPACSNHSTDHAVLVVGYGNMANDQQPYWLVKNR